MATASTSLPTLADLSDLIDFLRAKGVVHYQGGTTVLTLLPEAPPRPEADSVSSENKKAEEKVGKDGLTRAQQEELYGAPCSDTAS